MNKAIREGFGLRGEAEVQLDEAPTSYVAVPLARNCGEMRRVYDGLTFSNAKARREAAQTLWIHHAA